MRLDEAGGTIVDIPELTGFRPVGQPFRKGRVRCCRMRADGTDAEYQAEWIQAADFADGAFDAAKQRWERLATLCAATRDWHQSWIHSDASAVRVLAVPQGMPLSRMMFSARAALGTALQITQSVLRSLQDWHRAGQLHGGINGKSVLHLGDSRVQLLDTEVFANQGAEACIAGPLDDFVFLAPEATGSLQRPVDAASDLYAVGVLLFGLLAGQPPIQASTLGNLLDQQLSNEPPRLRSLGIDVPQMLDELVMRLLRRDPRERYQDVAAVLADVTEVQRTLASPGDQHGGPIGTTDLRSTLTEPSLVGRQRELQWADRALEQAAAGRGVLGSFHGHGSSGRSAVLTEIALRAQARQMIVLRGSAASDGGGKPLQAFEGVFASIHHVCSADAVLAHQIAAQTLDHGAMLSKLAPALAFLWPGGPTAPGPRAYGERRAVAALDQLLASFANLPQGVALLIDNYDLADELTKRVVRCWTQRYHGASTMHVTTVLTAGHRQHVISADPSPAPPSIDRQPGAAAEQRGSEAAGGTDDLLPLVQQMILAPLSDEQIGDYLASVAGRITAPMKRSIVAAAGGSPLMASTILSHLIQSGAARATERGWEADALSIKSFGADQSVSELLIQRTHSLPPNALRLLSSAAISGMRFALPTMATLAELSFTDALDIVTQAIGQQLVCRDTEPGYFRFTCQQVRGALCDRLDPDAQRELHLRAAAELRQNHPDDVFALAYHYDAAGQREPAMQYALLAAGQAQKQFALDAADQQYRIAQKWMDPDDHPTALRIAEATGDVHLLAGRYVDAEQSLSRASQIAATVSQRVRVQYKLGELSFKRGDMAGAADLFQSALRLGGVTRPQTAPGLLLELITETAVQTAHTLLPRRCFARHGKLREFDQLRLQLLSRLSHTYWFSRGKLWTLANHLRTLNWAERYQPSETLAALYSEHAPVMSLLRWFRRADRYAARSLELRRSMGNLWGQGQSLHYQAVVHLAACRFKTCVATCQEAVSLLQRTGDVWEMNMARYQMANALYRLGRTAEAAELAARIHRSGLEIGDSQASGISLDVWVRSAADQVPLETVRREAEHTGPDAQSFAQTQLAYAVALLCSGNVDQAVESLQQAIARCRQAGHLNTYISPCYAWLATALRQQLLVTDRGRGRLVARRTGNLRQAARRALRVARSYPADLPHAWREWGLLQAILGRPRQAAQAYRISLRAAVGGGQLADQHAALQELKQLAADEPDAAGPWTVAEEHQLQEVARAVEAVGYRSAPREAPVSNLSLADRFRTVLQSGRQIAKALSTDVVYTEAGRAARRLLRGQHAAIVRVSVEDERWNVQQVDYYTGAAGEGEPIDVHRVLLHEPLLQRALREGNAVRSVAGSPESPCPAASALAVPITFRGSPVAVILVLHQELQALFGPDELRMAEFVATLAGAALENADGFRQLQQLNQTLEQRVQERTEAAEHRAAELAESNQQLRETQQQLRQAITDANAASEAKGRFLATMSHEIRTPLNGILGMTQLAQKTSLDQQQEAYLTTVQRSGEALLHLINDLLDFSKIDAGKMELEAIEVDLREIVADCLRLLAPSAWNKQLELICSVDHGLPSSITGDPARIRQIVMNLVGNAIKFTQQGHITVRLTAPLASQLPASVQIAVTDTGIGIAADKQHRIFESFSQADSSTTRRYGGSGLGLAISSELAQLMGGKIAVDSRPGHGSTFTLTLPLTGNDPVPPRSVPRLSDKRIVLVEPLPATRHAICDAFAATQAEIVVRDRAEEIDRHHARAPELVILAGPDAARDAEWLAKRGTATLVLLPPGADVPTATGEHVAALYKPVLPHDLLAAAARLLDDSPAARLAEPATAGGAVAAPADVGRGTSGSELPSTMLADADAVVTSKAGAADAPESPALSGRAPAEGARPDGDHLGVAARRPVRILVAEDGPINREVITGLLGLEGYQVCLAHDGVEAAERASAGSFDVCLMDVDMPRMDGMQATQQIRRWEQQQPSSGRLPILAMTAHHDAEIRQQCLDAGMDGHLSKPVQPDQLFAAIARYAPAPRACSELKLSASEK